MGRVFFRACPGTASRWCEVPYSLPLTAAHEASSVVADLAGTPFGATAVG